MEEEKILNMKLENGREIPLFIFPSNTLDQIKARIRRVSSPNAAEIRLYRKDERTEITSAEEFFPIPGKTQNPLGEEYFDGNGYFVFVKDKDWKPKPARSRCIGFYLQKPIDDALSDPLWDPRGSVDAFVDFLVNDLARAYDLVKHFSPYTTLVASSMTGKTRHCFEALKKVWGVYICWRDPKEDASPRPSYILSSVSYRGGYDKDEKMQEWFVKMILTCMKMAHEAYKAGQSKEEWLARQCEPNDDYSFIGEEFWKQVLVGIKQMDLVVFQNGVFVGEEAIRRMLETYDELENFFVFCDSSRFLVPKNNEDVYSSLFHHLRFAAKLIVCDRPDKMKLGLGLVFVNALSQLKNNLPSANSLRPLPQVSGRPGKEIMSPYLALDTWDAAFTTRDNDTIRKWFEDYLDFAYGDRGSMPASNVLHGAYLKRGRPAWQSYLNRGLTALDMLRFARMKMLVGQDWSPSIFKDMAPELATAILCCRFCLNVKPWSKLASDLVESYMAQCLHVSDDRNQIFIGYSLDGYLTEACCQIMHYKDNQVHLFLDKLHDFLASGAVNPGPKGEFLTRLLVCLAMDAALQSFKPVKETRENVIAALQRTSHSVQNPPQEVTPVVQDDDLEVEKVQEALPLGFRDPENDPPPEPKFSNYRLNYVKPVTVHHFLRSLFPADELEKVLRGQLQNSDDMCRFLNGLVFFNRCRPIYESPSIEILQRLFYSCQFAQCRENEADIDQIIPVLLHGSEWSFIGVQSRLYGRSDPKYKKASSTFESTMYGVDLLKTPCMLLYFSMGYKKPRLLNIKNEKSFVEVKRETWSTKRQKVGKDGMESTELKHICIGAFGISRSLFPFLSQKDVESINSAAKAIGAGMLAYHSPKNASFLQHTMNNV